MYGPPYEIPSIPKETIRSARSVFGPGNFYIQVGDQLGAILDGIRTDWFSELTQATRIDAFALPLVTFFEFIEGLTDEQVTEAVRARMDWKFALHLPVNAPVFHQSILCAFRHKVVADNMGRAEVQKLVDRLLRLHPPLNQADQSFEILALLSTVCLLNRLHRIQQVMQQTLGALAGNHPEWLRQIMLPHWYGRFNPLPSGSRPALSVSQNELALEQLGVDIHYLLEAVQQSNLAEIKAMREIKALRYIWERQFEKRGTDALMQSKDSKWNNCDSCWYEAG